MKTEVPTANAGSMSRRDFLITSALFTAGLATTGCAVNPVTGESQLMLMSASDEVKVDKQHSPHQFSADYGVARYGGLNRYLSRVGKEMAARTHRPEMPYSFRCVNATYVNAYAFPGGTIAVTRGILLNLENEAELAALIGHELGHVNARHTASQMSKGMLTNAMVGGVVAIAGGNEGYGKIASSLGMIGAGMLLASYSRDNERQADALGLQYMVRTGYGPQGFAGLMDMLRGLSKHNPGTIELMFSTHPMSDERYRTAITAIDTTYAGAKGRPLHRQRYMDSTAGLRRDKLAIETIQKGGSLLAGKKLDDARVELQKALRLAPDDYVGLVTMAKCQFMRKDYKGAIRYAQKAQRVYPTEAQGYHVAGFAKIKLKRFESAYNDFVSYDKNLPGNANTTFFKGYALEGMQRTKPAGDEYIRYLNMVKEGEQAQYAYKRLVEWGRVRP